MSAGGINNPGAGSEGIQKLRARCERCRDLLSELTRIHLEVDAPTRRRQADEPDWIARLRKICLHVMAISGWEIGADVEHVMATELRAAYEQMDAVWKRLPATFRLDEMGGGWWAEEARNGMLATYDHPTPQSLMLSPGRGVFFQRGEQHKLCTTCPVAGLPRTRVRTCARLPSSGAGHRRGHHVSCDGGAEQVCRGTMLKAIRWSPTNPHFSPLRELKLLLQAGRIRPRAAASRPATS